MSWIKVGVNREGDLPPDRLSEHELTELRRLVQERSRVLAEAAGVEQQMQLLLMVARDRRGLVGAVRVDPESGMLEVGDA